ncbi:MAG: chorismate-binding protein, partial [Muribaculaceae bacterium]|nr:chorismate-binding protein [Muribaculaceae bacterium]
VSLSHSVKRSRLIENPVPTAFSEYAKGFNHIVDSLKTAGGKTVLSRVIRLEAERGVDWTRIIDNLFDRADINTFRFVYYTLETGVWLGASPELLLKEDASGVVSTMALAGTRPVGVSDWDDKNRSEHQMVVEHIVDCFKRSGLDPEVSAEQTVTHGKLQHLRHEIIARTIAPDCFDALLSALNPTPALAGWPVDESLMRIATAEKQPRYCYGGYISLMLPDGSRVAYVNLRSCYVSGQNFYLYCGGGLTAQSQLESEWDETTLKSTAMRSILEL